MLDELVLASAASVPSAGGKPGPPELVERAGGAARFAWEEFSYAEHHNRHTQRAHLRAVKAFLSWCGGAGGGAGGDHAGPGRPAPRRPGGATEDRSFI